MKVGYAVVERYFPKEDYKNITGMFQVEEIVSIDYLLCSSCIHTFKEEDDQFIFRSGNFCDYDIFNNLDYLLSKVHHLQDKQILAVIREPEQDCQNIELSQFKFYGYDLLEEYTRRSVLTNCCGLYDPFFSKDISKYGLIEDYEKARQIKKWIVEHEPNVECTLWGIYRMEKKR